ncbi:SDR family NAD(P)-dependent oxidoreductase [Glycocaulis profundi]|nr:SDR family NAD(P)-dependent oxidoreductase [Glycocaulis profundi]
MAAPLKIIVTGACGALGTAVSDALAAEGHKVAGFCSRTVEPRSGFTPVQVGDIADPAEAQRAVTEAAGALGGVDALVCIAGGFVWETIADGAFETWQNMFDANLKTALAASLAALPRLPDGAGRIVMIGAAAAQPAGTGMGAYAASKSAVARLVESLADELKPRKINVNAVLPSIIDTPANRRDMPDADPSDWVGPSAIADVIGFLVSNRSRAITGALIPVTQPGA